MSGDLVTVGRWMSQREFDVLSATGVVPESTSGTTHVAYPADPAAFMAQAAAGSIYVEFDVPRGAVKQTQIGWAKIIGPSSLEGRMAVKKGQAPPQMPPAVNIRHVRTKP